MNKALSEDLVKALLSPEFKLENFCVQKLTAFRHSQEKVSDKTEECLTRVNFTAKIALNTEDKKIK